MTNQPESVVYQCILCRQGITADEPLDPCALVLVAHFDRPRDQQKEQTFYCHAQCFRRAANQDGLLYILEPDFPTIGELDS